jgi:hypothetical protein
MAYRVEGHEEQAVLLFAFDCIGFALFEVEFLSSREIESKLAGALQQTWNFPQGTAKSVATAARHFWDESGVFVAEGTDHRVRPRLRLFAELGAARRVSQGSNSEQQSWVRTALPRLENEEVLLLLASLSSVAAATLVDVATATGRRRELLLAARAAREGFSLNSIQVEQIARALLAQVKRPVREDWELVNALLDMPVTAELVDAVESVVATIFAPAHVRTVQVFGWMKRYPGTLPPEDILLPLLSLEDVPSPPSANPVLGRKNALLASLGVDHLYVRTVREVADRLPAGRSDLARRLLAAHTSAGGWDDLRRILRQRGYSKEVDESIANESSFFKTDWLKHRLDSGDVFFQRLLQCLKERAEPETPWKELRRMDQLCQFVRTLIEPELPAFAVPGIAGDDASLLAELAGLVVQLGGFDPGILGAQASCIDSSQDRSSVKHDAFALEAVSLSHWPPGEQSERLLEQVLHLFVPDLLVLDIATRALLDHPDPSRYLHHLEALALAPGYGIQRRNAAVLVYMNDADPLPRLQEWARSSDSFLQKVAASACADLHKSGKLAADDMLPFFQHPDGAVRAVMLNELRNATVPVDLSIIPPPQSWSCHRCGTSYTASTETCSACKLVRPTCLPWFPSLLGTHYSPF